MAASSNETGRLQAPVENVAQTVAIGLTKAAMGAVPVFGSFGAEALDLLVTVPSQKRQREFWREVCEALERLQRDSEIDWRSLEEDPSFSATVSVIVQAVSRTANEAKLVLLRDAAVSSAKPGRPLESIRHRFIRAIDELEPEHVSLLSGFSNQSPDGSRHVATERIETMRDMFGGIDREVLTAWTKSWCAWLPETGGQELDRDDWIVLLLSELQRHGFVSRSIINRTELEEKAQPNSIFGPTEKYAWRRTMLGQQFVSYIASARDA